MRPHVGRKFNTLQSLAQVFFCNFLKKCKNITDNQFMKHLFPIEILDPVAMKKFGQEIGVHLKPGNVLALVGDLGAGKTHITQGIAEHFGYLEEVTSPTFALVNEYETGAELPDLIHFDLYRLEQPEDLLEIGWEDYLERDVILIVEWADRFPELMPSGTMCILIEHLEKGRRLSYDIV